jgi:hypothetical protein
MSSWGNAFRGDYTEPPKLSEDKLILVSRCETSKSEGLKTWQDVFIKNKFIGMVRVKISGECTYRTQRESAELYAGEYGSMNSNDPKYALPILVLLESLTEARNDVEKE